MAATKRSQQRYTDDEQRAALELGAAVGRRAAVRQLGIAAGTFQAWTEKWPELWSDLRAGDRKVQKTRVAQNLEDLADQYSSLEFEALERAEKLIPTADAREISMLIKSMGASRGVAAAGSRAERGEDHEVIEHQINFPALEQAAEAILSRGVTQPALQVPNEAVDEVSE